MADSLALAGECGSGSLLREEISFGCMNGDPLVKIGSANQVPLHNAETFP